MAQLQAVCLTASMTDPPGSLVTWVPTPARLSGTFSGREKDLGEGEEQRGRGLSVGVALNGGVAVGGGGRRPAPRCPSSATDVPSEPGAGWRPPPASLWSWPPATWPSEQ